MVHWDYQYVKYLMFIYQFEIILYFITVCNEVTMNEHYNL